MPLADAESLLETHRAGGLPPDAAAVDLNRRDEESRDPGSKTRPAAAS